MTLLHTAADRAIAMAALFHLWAMVAVLLGLSFISFAWGALPALGLGWWFGSWLTGPAPPDAASSAALHRSLPIAILAATIGLVVHRPDGDDGFYLGQIAGTLAHPDRPVLGFDTLHGDPAAPIQQPAHRAQSYELLVTLAAWLVPALGHENFYYIAFPILWSAAFPLTVALLTGTIGDPRRAPLAALGAVLLATLWGGENVTPGNFGLARIFQGKAVFATTWMPLVCWSALRYGDRPDRRTLARLAAALFGSALFTSSALVVAPVGAALVAVPFLRSNRRAAVLAGIALACLPSALLLLRLRTELRAAGIEPTGWREFGLREVYGPGLRLPVAYGLFALVPLAANARRHWAYGYMAAVGVLLLTGVAGALLGSVSAPFQWRILWAFPALCFGGIALSGLATLRWRGRAWGRWVAAVVLVSFAASGPWIGATVNRASWGLPGWDRDPFACAMARRALEGADHHPVLLHREVAVCATARIHRPPLVAVRRNYLAHLARHFGDRESHHRLRLLRFASGQLPPRALPWALDQLDERCVHRLVLAESALQRYPMAAFRERRWRLDDRIGPFVLLGRPEPCDRSSAIEPAPPP